MSKDIKMKTEILIIGGGSIGVCSAHFLNQAGHDVTLVDKDDICAGSSYGNAGLVVPSHSIPLSAPGVWLKGLKWMFNPESPFYIKPRMNKDLISWLWKFKAACNKGHMHHVTPLIREMSLASVILFDKIANIDGLEFDYEKRGHLIAYITEKGLEDGKAEARILTKHGIETQVMDAEELQALDPEIESRAIGGIFYPQDAHLTPHKFVNGLATHIQRNGVKFHSAEAIGFESSDQQLRKVITTKGDIEAEQVVIAAGSWSPLLGQELGINLPIQPAKGYSITFKRPETSPTVGISLAESKVAVTPMGDRLRFAGTLELAGLDFAINKRRVQAILNAVPKYMPQLDPSNLEVLEIWRGLRPCSPDGLPFLGRSRFYKNLILAAGHAMIGISLGPITGKLVTQITREETPMVDLAAMSPERFE